MRYTAARDNVEEAEEEIQLCCLSRHALERLLISELLLDLKGLWQSYKRKYEPEGELKAKHHEDDVRRKQQQSVENMRGGTADKNGQCHNAHLLIRFRVSRVVAVQDRFDV